MMAMRVALVALATAPLAGPVLAEAYADLGRPDQCGAYAEAQYDRQIWFPGGEGGAIALHDPQSVRGLNALLFDGVLSEEGANEPAGRVLATRGPLIGASGAVLAPEVLVVVTERGIRLLQRCP
jgi:hypothetical protein